MDVTRLVGSLNFSELLDLKKACQARIDIMSDANSVRIGKVPPKDDFGRYLQAIHTIGVMTKMEVGDVRAGVDAVNSGQDWWVVIPPEAGPLSQLADVGVEASRK